MIETADLAKPTKTKLFNLTITLAFLPIAIMPALTSLFKISTYGGFDVSWFSQVIFNIGNIGKPFVTMERDYNHMAQHFEPILYLIGWLYAPFQGLLLPFTLLMTLQAICQAIVGLVLLRSNLSNMSLMGSEHRIVFAICYFFFWGVISAQTFEFHPVTLGMSIAAIAVVFNLQQSSLAILFWVLSALCGEMFLVIAPVGTGLSLALKTQHRFRSILPLLGFFVGCAFLFGYLGFLAPAIRGDGQQSSLLGRYADLGSTPMEIVLNLIKNPAIVLPIIFTKAKTIFLAKVLLFFLPAVLWLATNIVLGTKQPSALSTPHKKLSALLFGTGCLAALVPLAKIILSNAETYLITRHHYLADVMPGLCLILAATLCNSNQYTFKLELFKKRYLGVLAVCILIGGASFIRLNLQLSEFEPLNIYKNIRNDAETILPQSSREALIAIDRRHSVYADTFGFSHLISSRRYYYTEFTHSSVYLKNGYPDYLILVFRPQSKAPGGYALHSSLEEQAPGLMRLSGSSELYRFEQKLPGQTDYGINIFRRVSTSE